MKHHIPVVCGIIEQDDKILIAKRNVKQSNAGLWEFPGGKVHSGELPDDALKRELIEELGIKVTIKNQLPPVFYDYPWISIQLIPFIVKIAEGQSFPHEHEEIRWIRFDELDSLNFAPADCLVIEVYRKSK